MTGPGGPAGDVGSLADRLAGATGAPVATAFGQVNARVERADWVRAARAVRDDPQLDGRFFDLLTVVDQHPGGFEVIVRLWSVRHRHAVLLSTVLPRDEARIDSLTPVYAGAGWHERQAHEMFGIDVVGHPNLAPLLLPPGGTVAPLRKEHLLERRTGRPWPGAQDPAHSGPGGRPSRRRLQPPGTVAP